MRKVRTKGEYAGSKLTERSYFWTQLKSLMAFVVSNTFLHGAVFSHCFPKANNLSHINIVFKALIQC